VLFVNIGGSGIASRAEISWAEGSYQRVWYCISEGPVLNPRKSSLLSVLWAFLYFFPFLLPAFFCCMLSTSSHREVFWSMWVLRDRNWDNGLNWNSLVALLGLSIYVHVCTSGSSVFTTDYDCITAWQVASRLTNLALETYHNSIICDSPTSIGSLCPMRFCLLP
jgi:hypothetical protein